MILEHGTYLLRVCLNMMNRSIELYETEIVVKSNPPEVELPIDVALRLLVLMILVSGAVAAVHYYISKRTGRTPARALRMLYACYGLMLGITLLALFIGGVLPTYNILFMDLGYHLSLVVFALIFSIFTYGLWIYIDSYRAFYLGKFSKARIILGAWQYFLPLACLYFIIYHGVKIEWVQEYVLEQMTKFGPFVMPALVASFLSAYLSVFSVVIITSYRDIIHTMRKIGRFEENEAPREVIRIETRYQIRRISANIRIKMLLFLGLLGLSTFSSVPIFQSPTLLIVAIPIAALIIGPYIAQVLTGAMFKE